LEKKTPREKATTRNAQLLFKSKHIIIPTPIITPKRSLEAKPQVNDLSHASPLARASQQLPSYRAQQN